MILRRTLTTLAVVALAATLSVAQRRGDGVPQADKDAMRSYVLTMPKVQAYYEASKEFQQLAAKDPSVRKLSEQIDIEHSGSGVESARRLEAIPQANAILKKHGLSGKDFVFTPMSLMSAYVTDAAQQRGKPGIEYVNPANVTFYRQHKAELQKIDQDNKVSSKKDDDGDDD